MLKDIINKRNLNYKYFCAALLIFLVELSMDCLAHVGIRKLLMIINDASTVKQWAHGVNYLAYFVIAILLTIIGCVLITYENNSKKIRLSFDLLFILSLVFIFAHFISGSGYYMYIDIGSDTVCQYYPFYVNEVRDIRQGTLSIFDWDYGLGANLLCSNAWIMDPFGMFTVIIGVIFGPDSVAFTLVWMQIVKITSIYVIARKYYSYILKNDIAICLAAILYSFNGYLLLWGQHFFLGTSCFYLILLLCVIERYANNNYEQGEIALGLVVACILMFSYYVGYMVAIAAALYFMIRLFAFTDLSFKRKLLVLLKSIFTIVVGALISAIIFVPSTYHVMTDSVRLNGTSSEDKWAIFKDLLTRPISIDAVSAKLCRMLSTNANGINDTSKMYFPNYYEGPALYMTTGIFFFFGQWLVLMIKKAFEKKRLIGCVLLFALSFFVIFNDAMGYFANGFGGLSYRYSFILMPFFALMIAYTVDNMCMQKSVSIIGLVIGLCLSIYTWIYAYRNSVDETRAYLYVIACILAMLFLLALFMLIRKKKYNTLMVMLVMLTIVSTAIDSWYTTNLRTYISKEAYPLNWTDDELDNDTMSALEWIDSYDDSFYRIAKDYQDWMGLEVSDSFIEGYSTVNVYNSVLNKDVDEYYCYIYKGCRKLSPAIRLFSLNDKLDQVANDIVNTKYLLLKGSITNDNWEMLKRFGDVIVYKNNNTESIAKFYSNTISEADFSELSEDEKAERLKSSVITSDVKLNQPEDDYEIGDFSLYNQCELRGRVNNMSSGILMLAIPAQEGWDIYVDGQKGKLISCDYGFIGTLIEPGEHEIKAVFHVPYLKHGAIASVVGVLLMLLYAIVK